MIDKSDTEINAIKAAFPDADIRICFFHVMQAWQRWLRTGKNHVPGARTFMMILCFNRLC